ncbi:MAG TPA: 2OG-Fe(II) oxygenase [Candidatus Sulfotelmatobacter sp.]|nr:2OG-Fe(II) oxygenase [Candidatus Sulfotelmatobacter sp.]
MTPKQILDSFSQTLLEDERILSEQERSLLTAIVQHANANGANATTQEAVRSVIASSVGEILAQRAFAMLGGSIVERILEQSTVGPTQHLGPQPPTKPAPTAPRPPSPSPGPQPPTPIYLGPQPPTKPAPTAPRPPSPSPGPQPPTSVYLGPQPPTQPTPPRPPSPGPQPPTMVNASLSSQSRAAIAERPEILPAKCIVLDEFLAPQELAELTRFTLEHEGDFRASEVVAPHSEEGVVNYEHRSSRVLMDLGKHQELMLERIKHVLPQVLEKLGMEPFTIAGVEAQVTASNDADFFHFHTDNGSGAVESRYLTFVYFFHREPRAFEGGELRIHDARLEHEEYVSEGTYQAIIPQQNQIVFFPCELLHEITPVKCASQHFADSRFTLNGWLRR